MNLSGKLTWVMTDHVCRVCFGRVMVRQKSGRLEFVFRCASCGAQAGGESPAAVCACGLTLEGTKDMGVRCQVNPERSPELIDEIIATVQGGEA
jgi:DNA-directed RNA polymerase subunit RPC12/RpoP